MKTSDETLVAWLSSIGTALANFSAQYNIQSISIVLIIMSQTECTSNDDSCRKGHQHRWVELFATTAIFLGAIIGQVVMGYLGDYASRISALQLSMVISVVAAIMTAITSIDNNSPTVIYALIIVFRFFLGIGAGGVYPLTATKASEDTAKDRDKVNCFSAAWSFFWQTPALIAPWLFAYILTYRHSGTNDQIWRFILAAGAIPSALSFCFLWLEFRYRKILKRQKVRRSSVSNDALLQGFDVQFFRPSLAVNVRTGITTTNPHSPSKQLDGAKGGQEHFPVRSQALAVTNQNNSNAPSRELKYAEIISLLRQDPRVRLKLAASGGIWFLYNVIVYGLGLLSGAIIDSLDDDDDSVSSNHAIRNVSSKQIIALSLSIPATFSSIYLLAIVGIKKLQIGGFCFLSLCLLFLMVFFRALKENSLKELFGLYCICSMALNVGLGITTFTLPAALFPKRVRSSFNGIAAAIGKLGAFVGAFSFRIVSSEIGFEVVIGMCSFIALCGAVASFLLISSKDLMTDQDNKESNIEDDSEMDEKNVELGSSNAPNTSGQPKASVAPTNKYNLNAVGFETDKSFSTVKNTMHLNSNETL